METQPFAWFLQWTHTTGPSEHIEFIKDIGAQGEVYAVETQATSKWLLNIPVKTKWNKTLWLPGPGEVLFIGCFALWVSHLIFSLLSIAFLPHPHPTPNSKSSLCNAQLSCSLRPPALTLSSWPFRCQLMERPFHWNLIHSSWIVLLVDNKHFIFLHCT